MLELARRQSGKRGGLLPQRKQEGWNLLRRAHPAAGDIVMEAEWDDPPVAEIAVKFEGLEIQSPEAF
jgi:hypothetical protein